MFYRRMSGMPAWDAGSPLAEMERIRRQMDRLFEGWPSGYASRPAGVFPPINLTEDKDSFFIRAELPGVASKDLDIQATSDSISIGGERKIPEETTEAKYHRREREAGKFSRIIAMPSKVDPDKVQASLENGILTLIVAKADTAKPRQISVR